MKKNSIVSRRLGSYLFALILIIIAIKIFIRTEDWELLSQVSIFEFTISILILLLIYLILGIQYYYLLAKKNNIKLSLIDIITLPISMSLWSYIIPIQGSLLYSIVFLKMKYKVKAVYSLSIGVYYFLITVIITGIVGIVYSLSYHNILSWIFLFSIIFLFSPGIIVLINYFFRLVPKSKNRILIKIHEVVSDIFSHIRILLYDLKMTSIIFIIGILSSLSIFLWYYWIITVMGFKVPIIGIFLLSLLITFSVVFKITPGNLGIQELLSGGFFSILGLDPGFGVLIAIYWRLTTLILTIPVGLLSTISNMKYFNVKNFKLLANKLNQEKDIRGK